MTLEITTNRSSAADQPLPRAAPPAQTTPGQAPAHVLMVRPHRFSVNALTAQDNGFQRELGTHDGGAAASAHAQVTAAVDALRGAGVGVHLFEDEAGLSPDSVFPNNWFTTHPDGRVLLCPMYVPNRRVERRADVVAHLRQTFQVSDVLDWSCAEEHGQFLEGTGSVVIDHMNSVAYGCRSHRLTPRVFSRFCAEFGLRPVLFDGTDSAGVPVYHTNVMLSIGQTTAVIGSELIRDDFQRQLVLSMLRATGRTVVELSEDQIRGFAGNVLELAGIDGPVLALSTTAYAALTAEQIQTLSQAARLLPVDVSTIEAGGGSMRCMLAGIHLTPR